MATISLSPAAGESLRAHGKFRKVRLKPITRYGQYRGDGTLELSDSGLRVSGRHVYSMGARWGFGLLLFVVSLIVTLGTFAPGFLVIYLLAEYVVLKREEVSASWSDVRSYVADSKRELIAVDFRASELCSPIVLRSPDWRRALDILREKVPQADAALIVVPAATKGRALWSSSWAFIGWYLLFFLCAMMLLVMILTMSGNVGGIPGIQSPVLRALAWLTAFGAPALPAAFLARRHFTRRRQDRKPHAEHM
jgi:hypothetical protein